MNRKILLIGLTTLAMTTSNALDTTFSGLNFGVGLSLTHDIGTEDRVDSATVVNGIVRVDEEKNDIARLMLETHYFFKKPGQDEKKFLPANIDGWGPFVAIQPGSSEIIEAIALGLMLGYKYDEDNKTSTSSWNIGIGAIVDLNVKVLGDGLIKISQYQKVTRFDIRPQVNGEY